MANRFEPLHPYVSYYTNLHMPNVISKLQYRYRGKAIIYGIRCVLTNMIYIGSSMQPGLRFHNHLISGDSSNTYLQADINKHGLDKFVVYVFEVVDLPKTLSYNQCKAILRELEQKRIDNFPKTALYNTINSMSS